MDLNGKDAVVCSAAGSVGTPPRSRRRSPEEARTCSYATAPCSRCKRLAKRSLRRVDWGAESLCF